MHGISSAKRPHCRARSTNPRFRSRPQAKPTTHPATGPSSAITLLHALALCGRPIPIPRFAPALECTTITTARPSSTTSMRMAPPAWLRPSPIPPTPSALRTLPDSPVSTTFPIFLCRVHQSRKPSPTLRPMFLELTGVSTTRSKLPTPRRSTYPSSTSFPKDLSLNRPT